VKRESTQHLAAATLLLFGLHSSVSPNPDRNWQAAQVHQIQRAPNSANAGDHWEYVLVSNGFVYTLRNSSHDAPYLNSSLGSEIKIASAVSGSTHPYDGDDVYVMDAKGQEHKMGLVSVVIADAGCKK
jgi:hypothetical protein